MVLEFVAGLGLGLAVAVPVGPMGVLCIGRTLHAGPLAGVATGLGAAGVHCLFGSVAALGLGLSAPAAGEAFGRLSALAGALILFWFAARLFRRRPLPVPGPPLDARHATGLCASAFLFGLTNPATFLLFASALPTILRFGDPGTVPPLAAGIFVGSVLWWVCLSYMVGILRLTLGEDAVALTNRLSAAALSAIGLWLVLRALA